MRTNYCKVMVGIFCLSLLLLSVPSSVPFAAAAEIPVKGKIPMVDPGAGACIFGKMMAPILERLKEVYAGKAGENFLDKLLAHWYYSQQLKEKHNDHLSRSGNQGQDH